jgi:hypothetical protein
MDPVNLNNSVLENGQGLVDSARLCQFLAQREEANAVGTAGEQQENRKLAGRLILPSCQFQHPGMLAKWQK